MPERNRVLRSNAETREALARRETCDGRWQCRTKHAWRCPILQMRCPVASQRRGTGHMGSSTTTAGVRARHPMRTLGWLHHSSRSPQLTASTFRTAALCASTTTGPQGLECLRRSTPAVKHAASIKKRAANAPCSHLRQVLVLKLSRRSTSTHRWRVLTPGSSWP